jgi:hypothetical protein
LATSRKLPPAARPRDRGNVITALALVSTDKVQACIWRASKCQLPLAIRQRLDPLAIFEREDRNGEISAPPTYASSPRRLKERV